MDIFFILGQPAKFKIKVKPTKNYPVDLYYLMDLSNSMKDDKGNLTRLAEDLGRTQFCIMNSFPDNLGFMLQLNPSIKLFIIMNVDLKNYWISTAVIDPHIYPIIFSNVYIFELMNVSQANAFISIDTLIP